MAREKKIEVEGVGSVLLRQNLRARNLTIRIKAQHGVRVTVPRGMSYREAMMFVERKRDWILKHLQRIRQREQEHAVFYNGRTPIMTRCHEFRAVPVEEDRFEICFGDGTATAIYPAALPLHDSELQAFFRLAYVETLRREAKAYLPPRLADLAGRHGFSYDRVFIKNHRSRWGSCSEKNNINLNLHLMRLSDPLIDYVLLHELVHTEIKNHSSHFWSRLAEVCDGDVAVYRRRMRKISVEGFVLTQQAA